MSLSCLLGDRVIWNIDLKTAHVHGNLPVRNATRGSLNESIGRGNSRVNFSSEHF